MYNYGGLTTRGVRSKFEPEFMLFESLAPARAACATNGLPDGIVQYHGCFSGVVPPAMLSLLGESTVKMMKESSPGVHCCCMLALCACVLA